MKRDFAIRSASTDGRIEFELSGDSPEGFVVRVISGSVRAEADIYDAGHAACRLPEVLRELAADWKGWEGARIWESLEGDLSLHFFWSKTGHVAVTINLRGQVGEEYWKVETQLIIEVGMLENLANEAEPYFAQLQKPY